MAINEETRQLDIAGELEATARTLAHSTRAVPKPSDSYRLLGELSATADHLAQLATWHAATQDGTHYDGEDEGSNGSPQLAAASCARPHTPSLRRPSASAALMRATALCAGTRHRRGK